MNHWVRLWHDMPTDPKWRVIARKSGQSVSTVIAVFNFMLVNASINDDERGQMKGLVTEDVAACLDIEPQDVESVISAMQGKVIEGQRLTGWDRRQPRREDNKATERVREWRERNALKHNETHVKRNETQCNASEQIGNACNADGNACNNVGNAPDTDTDTENKTLSSAAKAEPKPPSPLDVAIQETAGRIYARHPERRRDCSKGAVASKLGAILRHQRKGYPEAAKIQYVSEIDSNHAAKCMSADWQKDGGEFAKALEGWLAPTMERYASGPGSGAVQMPIEKWPGQLSGRPNPGLVGEDRW